MFKEKVKALIDQECLKPKVHPEDFWDCGIAALVKPHESGKPPLPECWLCHKHDSLAAQIAEIKE